MATALDTAANLTGASITEGQAKTWFTAMRAALAEMGDPMARFGAIQNLSLAFSVGSNALTANVKTRSGAAPSATDPVTAAMRNTTLATGDFNGRNITGALSLVISSGSTLGHQSAVAERIHWYLIDNAGTLELAASTKDFGPYGIVTTTAEGGAGGADGVAVMYSATARTNVPFRRIGRTIDTQTTAGIWAAVPSTVELEPVSIPDGGVWTPGLAFGGVATGITYAARAGLWVATGKIAFLQWAINLSNKGSSTGPASVTGMPPVLSPLAPGGAMGALNWSNMTSSLYSAYSRVQASDANVYLLGQAAAGTGLNSLLHSDFANNSVIEGSILYGI